METLITPLVNLGIGGILLGVFLLFGHHLVTRLIPNLLERREADLAWARAELEKKRAEYLAMLNQQHLDLLQASRDLHQSYIEQLTRLEVRWNHSEARWEKAVQDICEQLERLETAFRTISQPAPGDHR